MICPCENGKPYQACCKNYHQGTPAPTAEALMRSRYTAYALKLEDYLLKTWHPDTRPNALNLAEEAPNWLGLQVKQAKMTSETTASVEFVARYKSGGNRAERLHELSRFTLIDGHWLYESGTDMS